jgi:Fur family ferric uptake transcriptional regulator
MQTKTSSPCPENEQDWLDCLRASGYRLTGSRRAVVEALANSQRALNATQIFDLAREQYPSLGLVSVYRTLEKLEQLELIQRVHHPDGCQAFIAGFTGHQHLLICRSCGKTEFFEGDDLNPLFERVSQESGYRIQEHWLQLFGLCVNCQEAEKNSRD